MSFDAKLLVYLTTPLMRYARKLTGSTDRARDLVQATFVRMLEREKQFAEGTDLRSWAFAIAHNIHVDGVKQAVRDAEYTREQITLSKAEITRRQIASIEVCEMKQALAKLPKEQREVIVLVALQDMSYEAAASVLGVPVGTVRSRLARARSQLWRLMNGAKDNGTGPEMERPKNRTGRAVPIPAELRRAAINALNRSTSITEAAKKLQKDFPSSTLPPSTLRALAARCSYVQRLDQHLVPITRGP